MNKLKETVLTLGLAIRYSFSFCIRNAKRETIAMILMSAAATVLGYLTIQATGAMVNAVQAVLTKNRSLTPEGVLASGLLLPTLALMATLILSVMVGRTWVFRNRWAQKLRFANEREFNEHRATLDVARFRSKEYDDLSVRIRELPTGTQTRMWFSDQMLNLFSNLVSFVLFGTALLWYKPVYALVILVASLPMMYVEVRFVIEWWTLFQELVPHNKVRSVLERAYHSTRVFVQALTFNQMRPLRKEIDSNTLFVYDAYDAVRRKSVRREVYTHLLSMFGLCAVVLHALWVTVSEAGQIGTLTVIIASARVFQGNLEAIVGLVAQQWNNAKGVILIERDFFGLRPLLKTVDPVRPKFKAPPRITLDRVSFSYPEKPENQVLKEVSFVIEPGSKTAIVGKSGNGKSTIAHLLMRHADPNSGEIRVDGIPLQRILPRDWNDTASALTQEYEILDRRVGAEIASSRLGEVEDPLRLLESTRFAHFDEVVTADPNGFDSQIGTQFGGRDFSGGEKQRLALARVFYRRPKVLILDEPDSHLDPESADRIIDNIFALSGITVVMITHHVSRAQRCDKVIVMKDGEVAEQGHPDDLLATQGHYSTLYASDKKRLHGSEVQ